jgi:hypothetical protein
MPNSTWEVLLAPLLIDFRPPSAFRQAARMLFDRLSPPRPNASAPPTTTPPTMLMHACTHARFLR